MYYQSATRPDEMTYYKYLLTYVDDLLCISDEPLLDLDKLDIYFKMKANSQGIPKSYLGGQINAVTLLNNVQTWIFTSSKYVQEAIRNVKKHIFTEYDTKLPMRVITPFTSRYRPKLDTGRELTDERALYFMSLIGILRWAIELGHIDITTEVSKLSSFLAAPRDGHLNQSLHIFAFLKKHHDSGIVFDQSSPDINEDDFKTNDDWTYFYGNEKESLPPNMPPPLGKETVIRCFVDADHAVDKITKRSRTEFIIFLNNAPIYWISKKQNRYETSTFGSELVAMKTAIECIRKIGD